MAANYTPDTKAYQSCSPEVVNEDSSFSSSKKSLPTQALLGQSSRLGYTGLDPSRKLYQRTLVDWHKVVAIASSMPGNVGTDPSL